MITWILGFTILIWVVYKRTRPNGKIAHYPLGMPRGTVRSIIAILIVSFPFTYILSGQQIPGLITNAVFLIAAFYFEARKGSEEKMIKTIREIMHPEKYEEDKKNQKFPLYLPKYSVRMTLLGMLTLILILNSLRPNVALEATNTLGDLFVIICLFLIGAILRAFTNSMEKKSIHKSVLSMEDYRQMTKYEVLEKLMERKESWWKRKYKSFLSITTLTAVIVALFLYTINYGTIIIVALPFYELTLRGALLLLVSVYYGLRD
ncbi:MAG: hypothetical protein ACTSR8_22265 [Promethearchaeota archaeon]